MDNIIPCSICNSPTSFERDDETQPREGEVCEMCDRWVCHDCVDWIGTEKLNNEWVICKECVKDNENDG